ncbi:MAG: FHA domain-containing protein [Verrucomicrobiota bacterium]
MKHVLIVTLTDQEPQQFELKGKRIGLGREVDNDVCLPVEAVSCSHLEFRKKEDGTYQLKDLDSTNGTRVNGEATKDTTLTDGDRLLIGETVPAHYLVLAKNETWEAAIEEGSDEDRKSAAEFASMSDRLEKLEANIEAKEEEAAKLEAQLKDLRETYQKNLAEYGEAQLALDKLQTEVAEKKHQGAASAGEIEKLEEDLLKQTNRVKVMSTDLAAKQSQISRLENSAPPVAPVKKSLAPAAAKPKAPAASKTIPLVKRKPSPQGNAAPTKVLTKKKLPPGRPPVAPILKKRNDS